MANLPMTQGKKNRDIMHIFIAIIIGLLIGIVIPPGNGITREGLTVLAIFVPTLYLWMAIAPTTWVSILFLAAFAMTGIRTPGQVWSQSVGHFTFTLVMIFMLFDNCLRETGAIKSVSDWFITRKFTQGRPYLFLFMFYASNLIIGLFMQNLALAIMFVALTTKICASIGVKRGDSLYTIMFLGVVWGNAVNHIASPIAKSIPNIIIGLVNNTLDVHLSYAQWIMVGFPFMVVMLGVTMLGVRIFNPDVTPLRNFDISEFRKERKPLGKRGKIALGALVAIFLVIMIPETLFVMGVENAILSFIISQTITVWAIVMVVILCLIRVKDEGSGEVKPVLDFPAAMKDVNVGVLLFIACVIFIGGPLGAGSAGIVDWMGNIFGPIAAALPMILTFALFCFIALLLTNFMASTVVATIMFFMGVAVFVGTNIIGVDAYGNNIVEFITSPMSMAWVMIGSFAGCIGVSIPASTATTALYYGPHIEVRDTWKCNIIFLLLTLVAVVAMTPLAYAVFSA
ncbi:MAG: SLC13 family permease [Oscillospiraceae bacterium]|nr:SLC13 family permease [Oscillospiraceae bacterium]